MTRFFVKFLHNFDLNPPYVDFDASRLEISRQVGSTIQNLIQFQFYLDIIIIFLFLIVTKIFIKVENSQQ